jgi:hypothetical protein
MFLTKPMQRLGSYFRLKHIIQLKFILMKNIALLLLSIILFVSSCKKDEVVATKTKTELLTATAWIVNEAEADLLGGVSVFKRTNTTNTYDLSKVKLKFNADGTATGTDQNGNASNKGTWKLSDNDTKIVIANTNIVGLDGSAIVLKLEDKFFDLKGTLTLPQYGLVVASVKMVPAP